MDYELLDSGDCRKLERFGKYILSRPSEIAFWDPLLPSATWEEADAEFTRDSGWTFKKNSLPAWVIELSDIKMRCQLTDFGHLGAFPEHATFWPSMQERVRAFKLKHGRELSALNLFAYTGGVTLALAKAGASVCHVDSAKGIVDLAKENSVLNALKEAPIRWIVDDAIKFIKREVKRGKTYDAIILDPPSFGRGVKGEIFKIEKDIMDLLSTCKELLSSTPDFVLFSCHTPEFSPQVMDDLMDTYFSELKGTIEHGEMLLSPKQGHDLPSGSYGRWISG